MSKELGDLEKIHALHRQGKLDEAKNGYQAFLLGHPEDSEALHALGLIAIEEEKFEQATDYLRRAANQRQTNPIIPLHLANVLKMQGLLGQATGILQEACEQFPDYAPAFNNLGILYYLQGDFSEAIRCYKLALKKQTQYIDAYYNLALALTKQGDLTETAITYQQLLTIAPDHAAARYQLACCYMRQQKWEQAVTLFLELAQDHPQHLETQINLASCYLNLGAVAEAKTYYSNALEINPQDPQALYNLGFIHAEQGNIGQAIQYYQNLIRQEADNYAAHNNLGAIYLSKKQFDLALHHYQQALRLQPENKAIEHIVNILQGDQNIPTSPPAYVKSLFDYYADHYEPHLLNTLGYQVPQDLQQAFIESAKLQNRKLDILDLGCGTGLCGEIFKPYAASLVGVDLSSKMLDVAAEKKIYDHLVCKDVMDFLAEQKAAYDLILAGDVLVYMGDLATLFKQVKQALRPQGLFIFNTEMSEQNDYSLNPYGRFAHHRNYLENLAKTNNLAVVLYKSALTRQQNNLPEYGHIYILESI